MKSLVWFPATVLCISAILNAQRTPVVPVVDVNGPTIVAFFPNASKTHSDDADANEALSDFEFYTERAKEPLNQQGIQFTEQFGGSFRIRLGSETRLFTPNTDTPGYYFIRSRNRIGEGFVIMNAAGDVPQYRVGVARNELPQTVQSALATLFHADKFTSFQRGEDRIYRVNEMAGQQRVDMWIRSDGEVVTVNEPTMPTPQAVPAAGHNGPRK